MNILKGSFRVVSNKEDEQKTNLAINWIVVAITGIATIGNLFLLIRGEFFDAHWLQQIISVLIIIWFVTGITHLIKFKK
jgi:fatty acid desaturase